jgi:hypothetical protein
MHHEFVNTKKGTMKIIFLYQDRSLLNVQLTRYNRRSSFKTMATEDERTEIMQQLM